MPGADQRISWRSYCASASRSARSATHFESRDQPTEGVSVKALDKKPLGRSEKSVLTAAVTTSLMPRTSELQRKRTLFPLGDHGDAPTLQGVAGTSRVE